MICVNCTNTHEYRIALVRLLYLFAFVSVIYQLVYLTIPRKSHGYLKWEGIEGKQCIQYVLMDTCIYSGSKPAAPRYISACVNVLYKLAAFAKHKYWDYFPAI